MGLLAKFRKEGKISLEKEVADHLSALFNTKQSFGAWQKGLGMRNYCSGKSRTDIIEDIVADIRYNIVNFEKRVKLIEILAIDDKETWNLRFQIKCQLGARFHSYYIGFKQSHEPIEVEFEP